MNEEKNKIINDFFEVFLLLKNKEEVAAFMNDVCTPQEIKALSERWHVCKLLATGDLSYRQIQEMTGISLGTIVRVSRFLNIESSQGYASVLKKIKNKKSQEQVT